MAEPQGDAASRLWWGLRAYRRLAALVLLAAVGAAVFVAPTIGGRQGTYRAEALVIADRLEIRPEQLPRLAEGVFNGGAVAEGAVANAGLPMEPRDLIPGRADLEPFENNILMRVAGYADDPALAQRIADAVAGALVEQLNRPGPGVGSFSVHTSARLPTDPEVQLPVALNLAVGIIGGVVLALGAVGLVMVVRRPVLHELEAALLAEVGVLGAPRLPGPRHDPDPLEVVGLAALVKRLFPTRSGVCVLVAPPGGERTRTQLSVVLARAMARAGPTGFVPSPGSGGLPPVLGDEPRIVEFQARGLERHADLPIVFDGPSTDGLDVPQFLPPDAKVALVVRAGGPQPALEAAVRQFLPNELAGVVFVRQQPGRVRRRTQRFLRRTGGAERLDAPRTRTA